MSGKYTHKFIFLKKKLKEMSYLLYINENEKLYMYKGILYVTLVDNFYFLKQGFAD